MSGALSSQTKLRSLSPVLTLRLSLNLLLILLRHSSQSHLPSHQPILGELSRPYCSNTSRAFGAKAFSRPTPSITVSTQTSQTDRVHRSQMGSRTRQSCSIQRKFQQAVEWGFDSHHRLPCDKPHISRLCSDRVGRNSYHRTWLHRGYTFVGRDVCLAHATYKCRRRRKCMFRAILRASNCAPLAAYL